MITVIDHKKSLAQLREEEHARQMRIVLWNAAGAVLVLIVYMVWL